MRSVKCMVYKEIVSEEANLSLSAFFTRLSLISRSKQLTPLLLLNFVVVAR
jgi:hypothetical protein